VGGGDDLGDPLARLVDRRDVVEVSDRQLHAGARQRLQLVPRARQRPDLDARRRQLAGDDAAELSGGTDDEDARVGDHRSPVNCQRISDTGITPAPLNSSKNVFNVNASPSWCARSLISASIRYLPVT